MLSVLANRTYRHLFGAQILSLIGTGLTTVALGLLAYDLAGADAGQVLGIALAIKMIAYVGISPFAGAIAGLLPRRGLLVTLDIIRAGMVLLLPLVTEVWQIYVLVFLFQSCSAAFTPTFQATIPDILLDEDDYTSALSLSRLAYDLRSLLSPLLAALAWRSSASIGCSSATPSASSPQAFLCCRSRCRRCTVQRSFMERLTRGSWIYFNTPRLRGLLALSFAVAASSAMVIVNTVVIVRAGFGGDEGDVAWFFRRLWRRLDGCRTGVADDTGRPLAATRHDRRGNGAATAAWNGRVHRGLLGDPDDMDTAWRRRLGGADTCRHSAATIRPPRGPAVPLRGPVRAVAYRLADNISGGGLARGTWACPRRSSCWALQRPRVRLPRSSSGRPMTPISSSIRMMRSSTSTRWRPEPIMHRRSPRGRRTRFATGTPPFATRIPSSSTIIIRSGQDPDENDRKRRWP